MSRLLEVGDTITRAYMSPSDWDAYVAELRPGDRIEYWRGEYGYEWTVQPVSKFIDAGVTEFTLIKRGQE